LKQHSKRRLMGGVIAAGLMSLARAASAGSAKPHGHRAAAPQKEQRDWGIAGDAKDVARTIDCRMLDSMRFSPERIDVKLGETIRFRARNRGKLMHEFVIGTRKENADHYALMKKFPKMEHDEPYMAHVPPGQMRPIVWTFNRPGEFEFACLIAGHYEAGMVGKIVVAAA
jgi:uncharacterized cupredoxin-like copper-binding protein